MSRTSTMTTLATAALALPLLAGSAQAAAAAEPAQGPQSPTAASTDVAGATDSPGARSNGTESNGTDAKGTDAKGATELKTVTDPCSSSCPIMQQITVEHPTAGPLEIRVYGQDHHADHGHTSLRPAYGVYQGSRAVGFEQSGPDVRRFHFTDHPTVGHQVWEVPDGRAVDKHGNVYLTDGEGVTVLTPTPTGYETRGTMPASPRSVEGGFHDAGLRIDASGEPAVSYMELDQYGVSTNYLLTETWSDGAFHVSHRDHLVPRTG